MSIVNGATRREQEDRIDELLEALSLEEKVAMLSGHGFIKDVAEDGRYCARMHQIGAGNERLGIPPLLFNDGSRGVAMGNSTCFPVPMARGASFDVDQLERDGVQPAFAFGFGLSYTRFDYANVFAVLDDPGDALIVDVDVTNVGGREGEAVVQIYAGRVTPPAGHPRKRLVGFDRILLLPGETRRASIRVALRDLASFDPVTRRWQLGTRDWRISAGASSAETDLVHARVELDERSWSIRER